MLSMRHEQDKGYITVILALLLTVLLGCCALVVDLGIVYVKQAKLQNAVDASALAASMELPNTTSALAAANQYIQLNGYTPLNITVSFSDGNNTISIIGSSTVDYYFAKIWGLNNKTLNASASAVKGNIPAALTYALFSTNPLTLNGSNQYVDGNVHTNGGFTSNGSNLDITGTLEALTVSVGSQANIGETVLNAPALDMPDFSDSIKTLADTAGQTIIGNTTYYEGSTINVDSSIYIIGDLTINSSFFSGKGTIVATGNITFNGSNIYTTSNDAVCIYSKNGNITINGSNANVYGMIYAPNGTIAMNGSNQTINGRVIGETVTVNGSNLDINVISNINDIKSLPTSGTKLIL